MSETAEFKIVAHVVSETKEGIIARLVLQDEGGFFRSVLSVGNPSSDFHAATESAIKVFETKIRGIK